MFAALKNMCNMKTEICHLKFEEEDMGGASVERWILSKISDSDEEEE